MAGMPDNQRTCAHHSMINTILQGSRPSSSIEQTTAKGYRCGVLLKGTRPGLQDTSRCLWTFVP